MKPVIGVATVSFAKQWAELRNKLWPSTSSEHLAVVGGYFAQDYPHIHIAFLALAGQEVQGFLELSLRSYAEGIEGSPVPYIEGWYVADEARGQGCGRALMERAAQWALSEGYRHLASDTELDNRSGLDAHQALGFVEVSRQVALIKELKT